MLNGRQLDLLVEIDAASNRGVEDARTLRDRLLQRPGGDGLTGRYKVYIIDEVHMLTKEAFNTLLKSLEEPPPHVIFVLATTDPQEVPPTILSRCQRFDFRSISLEQLVAHLAHIAQEEGVSVETRALETIARAARGGLRDAIGLLDQAFAYVGTGASLGARQVGAIQVDAMLGLSPTDAIAEVVRAIGDSDLAAALRGTHAALDGGAEVRVFARQVVEALRAILLVIGGAPDVVDLDPGLRDAVALHARRFTLGRTIRAIKALAALDVGLRTRAADAKLLFEVAIAEIVSEAPGMMGAVAPSQTDQGSPSRSGTVTAQQVSLPVASRPTVNPATAPNATTPAPRVGAETQAVSGGAVSLGAVGRPATEAAGVEPQLERSDVRRDAPFDGAADGEDGLEARTDGERGEDSSPSTVQSVGLEPRSPAVGADRFRRAVEPGRREASAGTWPTTKPPARAGAPREPYRRRGASPSQVDLANAVARWSAVIERVGTDGMVPIVGLLQDSFPSGVDPDGVLAVSCGSTFFVQKLREPANHVGIERCASQVLEMPVRLRFHVNETATDGSARRSVPSGAQDALVARATRLLGGRALTPDEVVQLDGQAQLPLHGLPD
jgi:DNA polymerase-3 subunit gamma/tau